MNGEDVRLGQKVRVNNYHVYHDKRGMEAMIVGIHRDKIGNITLTLNESTSSWSISSLWNPVDLDLIS